MRIKVAPARTTLAIEVSDLTFAYDGHTALDGLSISVPTGSLCGLLGPNGSGKSTLLSVLAGLRTPDSGSAAVLGQTPSPALRSRAGFLFQETCLDPLMTVRETLFLHGRLYGMSASDNPRRAGGILEAVRPAERPP